eukprot:scaffold20321_cov19-Tisochrysis_lutea.AAC.1
MQHRWLPLLPLHLSLISTPRAGLTLPPAAAPAAALGTQKSFRNPSDYNCFSVVQIWVLVVPEGSKSRAGANATASVAAAPAPVWVLAMPEGSKSRAGGNGTASVAAAAAAAANSTWVPGELRALNVEAGEEVGNASASTGQVALDDGRRPTVALDDGRLLTVELHRIVPANPKLQ